MSDFKFQGDWETKIRLSEFSKFSNPKFFKYSSIKNPDGTVMMKIDESRNLNPDPENNQFKTINFLLNEENQKVIIKSIFDYVKEIAYPDVQSRLPKEEHPDDYPNLEIIDDLFYVVGLVGINIHDFHKDGFAIYTLSFNSSFNYENSLNLTIDKTKVLDHIEWYDFPSDKVVSKLGGRDLTEEEYEKIAEEEKIKKLVYHLPHPKYGKLKSWQKSENKDYPFHLLNRGNYDELKSFIKSYGHEIEHLNSMLLNRVKNFEIDIPKELEELLKN